MPGPCECVPELVSPVTKMTITLILHETITDWSFFIDDVRSDRKNRGLTLQQPIVDHILLALLSSDRFTVFAVPVTPT